MKEKLLKLIEAALDMAVGESSNDKPVVENDIVTKSVEVRKSVDKEQRRALFIVLEPQEDDGTTADLHGDWYDEESVINACRSFNVHCRKANLLHKVDVSTDKVVIEQSYCTPVAFDMEDVEGDIVHIKKNTWLMEQHYPKPDDPEDDDVWPLVESGDYCGVSINCSAEGYEIK